MAAINEKRSFKPVTENVSLNNSVFDQATPTNLSVQPLKRPLVDSDQVPRSHQTSISEVQPDSIQKYEQEIKELKEQLKQV